MGVFLTHAWRLLGVALVLLPAFFTQARCDLDNPVSSQRSCTNNSVRANTPFLVKSINYTKYDASSNLDFNLEPYNALTVFLGRSTLRPGSKGDWCKVIFPVCRMIECVPIVQDSEAATNDGKTIITDFLAEIPGDAFPQAAASFSATATVASSSPTSQGNSLGAELSWPGSRFQRLALPLALGLLLPQV